MWHLAGLEQITNNIRKNMNDKLGGIETTN